MNTRGITLFEMEGIVVGFAVNFTKFDVPNPLMPLKSREDPELAKLTEAKVRVLVPAPDMVMNELELLSVNAPKVSLEPPVAPTKARVPPAMVNAAVSEIRPAALLPPLLTE